MTDIKKLLEAIAKAAAQFRIYEASHRAKGTPDGVAKADVNAQWAADLEALAVEPRKGFFRCTRCGRDEIDGRIKGCERGPCPMEYVV